MATFEIQNTETGEIILSRRITAWGEVNDIVALISPGDPVVYRFRGKPVSRDEIFDICESEREKYFSKRRPIRVHQGASNAPNTWSTKWVLK